VVSNGTYAIAKSVVLKPHSIATIPVMGIENATVAQLYSPVSENELGDHPIPINQYGFALITYKLSPGNSQAASNQVSTSNNLYVGMVITLITLSIIILLMLRRLI
jgi:hypothetical protein